MPTVTIEEAQAKLPYLIHALAPGDEVVITEHNQPVAKLGSAASREATPTSGSLQGNADDSGRGR